MSEKKSFPHDQEVIWQPEPALLENSNLNKFMQKHHIDHYHALYERSIQDVAWFWEATLKDLAIEFYQPYTQILDTSRGIQFPTWCIGGKMNIVHNCLDKWQKTAIKDSIAIKWEGEEGITKTFTYQELHEEVCKCANALRTLGLGKGDIIGLFMPMTPEIVIAFLAIIKIGGVILPLFSGYGVSALVTRLKDAQAKALFTSDGVFRRGKPVLMKPVADEALLQVPSVKHVIVHNRIGASIDFVQGRDLWWHELIPHQSNEAPTTHTHAEDMCMLIYTSGTTGKPKGAVHTHCGFPIKGAQDMYHCMDVKQGDTMYWMSDMGWMMGPWLVFGTLVIGASMVLYDGAPDYPDIDRLWAMVDAHHITHLGISPVLIRALKPHGTAPIEKHRLSTLRAMASTGSPWDPESWLWAFQNVLKSKKPILNYSGGTEISGGILCGNFYTPLKPCAFSGPVPGMDADVVDEAGNPVRNAVGELVIRKPWIGMTRGFWQDETRYLETYWQRFENVWVHGDFAFRDDNDLWYILGRSDDTIKVAGKRLGPAEVEAIVNQHECVAESAAIGVPDDIKGETLVVFCVVNPKNQSETLRKELIQQIVEALGKPLKPKALFFAAALPKTRNAKVMRRLIRAIYLNQPTGDMSSLENPETLDAIRHAH